jgi:hypothetical protein
MAPSYAAAALRQGKRGFADSCFDRLSMRISKFGLILILSKDELG